MPEGVQARKVTSSARHLKVFLPLESLEAVAALDCVAAIHPAIDEVPQTVRARELMQQSPAFFSDYPWYSNMLWFRYGARYTGREQVIVIADTGMSLGVGPGAEEHPAFRGRIFNTSAHQSILPFAPQALNDDDDRSHGTHVAGCAAGWNRHLSWTYRKSSHMSGTAPDAKIYVQKYTIPNGPGQPHLFSDLAADMIRGCPQAKIHSNSYGVLTDDNVQKSYAFTERAAEVDEFTTQNPAYLVLFGAANSGQVMTSGSRGTVGNRADVVFNRQVSAYGGTKNALTVGATWNARDMMENFPGDETTHEERVCYEGDPRARPTAVLHGFSRRPPLSIWSLSSKGPTTSNMLKPEIVAPGCGILSSATKNAEYQRLKAKVTEGPIEGNGCAWPDMVFQSGTSMSTPQVAGLAACLLQAAARRSFNILGSTLRAILVNGAVSCAGQTAFYLDANHGGAYQVLGEPPDCCQGFGQASYQRSILHIDQAAPVTPNGYGPIGFHQAGDRNPDGSIRADGIPDSNRTWPDTLTDATFVPASYILPGRNDGQLRVTLAYNDLDGPTLEHQLRLRVFQQGFNPTARPPTVRAIADRPADPVRTYPAMDHGLLPAEIPVTLGTVQKVTWRGIDASVLQPGEVMRFQMKVFADRIVHRGGPVGSVGFSLAWVSSADDNF